MSIATKSLHCDTRSANIVGTVRLWSLPNTGSRIAEDSQARPTGKRPIDRRVADITLLSEAKMRVHSTSKLFLTAAVTGVLFSAASHAATVPSSTDEARALAHYQNGQSSSRDHRLVGAAPIDLRGVPGSTDEARAQAAVANAQYGQVAAGGRATAAHGAVPQSTDEARELASQSHG